MHAYHDITLSIRHCRCGILWKGQ